MIRCVVLGGGMAGLAAAYRLQQASKDYPLTVRLVEAEPRLGGKVVSEQDRGFLFEGGPDSFVTHKPAALDLVRQLGIEDRLMASNDQRGGASIYRDGRLCPLPEGFRLLVPGRWGPFLRSPLLSWRGKLRLACEPWIAKSSEDRDESVADFVRRRLGHEALERLAEPLLAHIHVADIERMSLLATYPRLRAMEERHGSLWRAMQAAGVPRGPVFWTLRGGIAELTDTVADRLPEDSKLIGRRAHEVSRQADGSYRVRVDGEELAADAVVLAMPAFEAAKLMRGLAPSLATTMGSLRYVSLATLSLVYRRQDISKQPPGFGFFVPRRAQKEVLAATWSSIKFDHRAPENFVMLRLFLAENDASGDLLEQPDDRLVERVRRDIERLIGWNAEPVSHRLYRWPKGYPQYDVGHKEILRAIDGELPERIFLAGSAFHGVGLPDCIQSGFAAAESILKGASEGRSI